MTKALSHVRALELMTPYLAQNYEPIPITGCWLWAGGWHRTGYGRAHSKHFWYEMASRLFYAYHVGDIPETLQVCHKCDTRPCVNPDHLFLGTAQTNAIDRETKGRGRWRGKHPVGDHCAKFTHFRNPRPALTTTPESN